MAAPVVVWTRLSQLLGSMPASDQAIMAAVRDARATRPRLHAGLHGLVAVDGGSAFRAKPRRGATEVMTMTQSDASRQPGPVYQLEMSRIFSAQPSAVRRAFADAGLRAQWASAAGRPMPDPSESAGGELLTWPEQLGVRGVTREHRDAGRSVQVWLHDEPRGKTRLELQAGPYAMAEEIDARAWWDSAFSALDTVLERLT